MALGGEVDDASRACAVEHVAWIPAQGRDDSLLPVEVPFGLKRRCVSPAQSRSCLTLIRYIFNSGLRNQDGG